jgi:hypothetical protein
MPRRRWFQFSLRAFLAAILAVGLIGGWFVERARREDAAIRRLTELGARISFAGQLGTEEMEPRWIYRWTGFDDPYCVVAVDVQRKPINGGDLWILERMPNLKALALWGAGVTDADCRRFQNLTKLELLVLQECPVTDNALPQLAHLQELELLVLGETKVRGHTLSWLGDLPKLESVILRGAPVETIDGLARAPRLRQLDVDATKVADEAIAWFRRERPDVLLEADEP